MYTEDSTEACHCTVLFCYETGRFGLSSLVKLNRILWGFPHHLFVKKLCALSSSLVKLNRILWGPHHLFVEKL